MQENLAWFFNNASSSFFLLFVFLYLSFVSLFHVFYFLCSFPMFSQEVEEKEEVITNFNNEPIMENHDNFVDDVVCVDEDQEDVEEEIMDEEDTIVEDDGDDETFVSDQSSILDTVQTHSEYEHDEEDEVDEEIIIKEGHNTPIIIKINKVCMDDVHKKYDEKIEIKHKELQNNFTKDEKFLIFSPPPMETIKKLQVQEKNINEEIFGDSTDQGSTSKSSSDWRSSINFRDSATEDPFSSSSRRSCPKWESYTVFQKYDEEMTFLDQISAQKLHETEKFNSFKACPRSISERILHKLAPPKKGTSKIHRKNPYGELEAAYVAQICLTWEALNWNYKKFQLLLASRREHDPGCPAHIAQQFQQFQVLLQRYVENEPYEHGKRPEIYSRMRISAPKLLQVPEYRDLEDEDKLGGYNSRISSAAFLMIMEEGIRTFMNFLKADREKHCQVLAGIFRKNRRDLVDPILVHQIKKENTKKKMKLKDLRRARKCFRKRSRLKWEEEVEILLALIDLKVVSRVLRMNEITDEQLYWCKDKMGKVKVCDGKLQRDSSPLFFPATH